MIQIAVIGGILFVLYRFLLKTIGVEQLGIWSLVLATTAITQIANLGLSGSVVKFVAKYVARGENENVSGVIQTAFLSVAIFGALILMIGYPIAKWIIGLIILPESLPSALAILPYAFLSLWIMIVTSIFQAGLDGYQRIDIRSILLIGGALLHLLLCFMLAPRYGLMGIAYARVVQNITILFCSWFFLKRYLPLLPIFPSKWNKKLFKEIIRYGMNFQIIIIITMLYDPITKALLSKFGGLSMVGYYEMASKMIRQFRALIVSANQVLVPAIADLKERTPKKIQSIYLNSYQLLFYLALPLYSLIIICIPIISELWIGHYERIFVIFGTLLPIGWFFNTLTAPSYFANLATGELRWNLVSHIAIALLNVGLGFLLGFFYGGIAVVVAWVISLALGSSIIYLSYHIKHKIPLIELAPKTSNLIIVTCLIGTISILIIKNKLDYSLNLIALNGIMILVFLMVLFIPIWLHPMRKRLVGWVINELLNKR
ncbi:MAG: oligosaccharide flippase family protein [Cellulophaga sp.]